jgi:mRNA-degrading endonuclease toxin of MazEF toxin-antitoxin module
MWLHLPDREAGSGTAPRHKHVVLLHDEDTYPNHTDIAVVAASSFRWGRSLYPYEVLVGSAEGFDDTTVIDCRWVFTVQKGEIGSDYTTTLPGDVMERIAESIVDGLRLYPS